MAGTQSAEIAVAAARLIVEEGMEYGAAKRRAARDLGATGARRRAAEQRRDRGRSPRLPRALPRRHPAGGARRAAPDRRALDGAAGRLSPAPDRRRLARHGDPPQRHPHRALSATTRSRPRSRCIDLRVDYDVGSVDGAARPRSSTCSTCPMPSREPRAGSMSRSDRARLRRPARRAPPRRARPQPSAATWRRCARCEAERMNRRACARRRRRGGRRGGRSRAQLVAPARDRTTTPSAPRSICGRSSFADARRRDRSRWRAGAASPCCSTSGRPGARPASIEMPLLDRFARERIRGRLAGARARGRSAATRCAASCAERQPALAGRRCAGGSGLDLVAPARQSRRRPAVHCRVRRAPADGGTSASLGAVDDEPAEELGDHGS